MKTIFVISNDLDVRKFLVRTLSQVYAVITNADLAEAIKKIPQEKIDLILIDDNRDDNRQREIEAFEKFMQSVKVKKIPVLLVTPLTPTNGEHRELTEIGITHFVCKPFKLEELFNAVKITLCGISPI